MNASNTATSESAAARTDDSEQLPITETGVPGRQSTWFGTAALPLLGAVHIPEGSVARGAVVLAPPIGKEQVDSYRGLVLLAQRLCAQGLLVLRFDYPGTGDSAGGQDDDGIVEQWQSSVVTAVDFVRRCGVRDVAVVGLRAGSLLAASVAHRCGPLTGMVFWDPVVSGRSYLREQRALYSLTVARDDESDPRVSIVGAVFHAGVAAEFSTLDSSKLERLDCPVFVTTRSERADAKPVRRLVSSQQADEHTLRNHDAFLEPPAWDVIIPRQDIDVIARWVQARFTSAAVPVTVPIRRSAVIATPRGDVLETIERLGDDELFSIRTTALATMTGGPAVVMYGTAFEHRVGPVRLWVELARTLATAGITSVRFDRRGTGESGNVGVDDAPTLYSELGDDDALCAVRSAGTEPSKIVTAGLCSGAWYAGYAAHREGLNTAILINMREWTMRRVDFTKRSNIAQNQGLSATVLDRAHTAAVRFKNWSQPRMPYRLWLALGRRGWIQVPEISLAALQRKGVHASVLLVPEDTQWFVDNRGPESLGRLRRGSERTHRPMVKSFADGDHTLFGRDVRDTVRAEMLQTIGDSLGVDVDAHDPPVKVNWTPL
ncbi:alpha/beta hydrolase [Rhodococcus fascians]|nr:alpha/beta hydrolase [Rhodococcus fascians]